MGRHHVDLDYPSLEPEELALLKRLIAKRDYYRDRFRHSSAHGVEAAIIMYWGHIKCDFQDTQPTNWGPI